MNKTGNRRIELAWERRGSCIIVTSHKPRARGYFFIKRAGRLISLHREICERRHGKLGSKEATHSCDNNLCINPDHIRPGSHDFNMREMEARGRSKKGSANAHSKLTEAQIKQIRADKRTHRAIAADYGVSHTVIGLAKRRKKWKHVA